MRIKSALRAAVRVVSRFGVDAVCRQRRLHPVVCEKIGDHSPLGHTVVPLQCVPRNLAAVPHFFQLRLFVRSALALQVHVHVHGFSVRSGEKPRNDQKLDSESEAVLVASVGQIVRESPIQANLWRFRRA
jgi:hypothetical protein